MPSVLSGHMSLTSLLRERHTPVREFFESRLPNLKGLQTRWRECGSTRIVSPTGAGPAGTIGTAFDYRLRYFFVVTPRESFVAVQGARRLAGRRSQEEAVEALGRLADGTDLFSSMLTGLRRVVDQVRPVGRRLTGAEETDLCRYCYVLARYDECYRTGWKSPLESLGPDAGVDDAMALIPDEAVSDLRALVDGLHRSVLATYPGRVIANPTFAGSRLVGGADADLIIGDCLIDAKATVQNLQRDWVYQLIGYALLDFDDAYEIRRVGFYHARVASLLAWDLQEMLDEAAGQPVDVASLRHDFRALLPTGQRSARPSSDPRSPAGAKGHHPGLCEIASPAPPSLRRAPPPGSALRSGPSPPDGREGRCSS